MDKLLTFNVAIEGLENKIWRKIQIMDRFTLADLAYTVLATFDSLAYHAYEIKYKGNTYRCFKEEYDTLTTIPAIETRLSQLNLKENDKLYMEYDFGSTTTFIITYESKQTISFNDQKCYPLILDGEGHGMLDDITDSKLKEIVEDTDEKGYSAHPYTPGYEKEENYDYRNYDLKEDNLMLKGLILLIKNGYEIE